MGPEPDRLGTVAVAFSDSFATALVAGIGVGLAYPGLYIKATTADASGFTVTELATAVITAECVEDDALSRFGVTQWDPLTEGPYR